MPDIYSAGIDHPNFTKEDRQYFQSNDFRNLGPSAKVSIFKQLLEERMGPTAEEIEAKNRRDDEVIREVLSARAEAERRRIEAIQQRQAELKKQFLN